MGRERRGWVQFAFLLNGSGKQISGLGWIGSLDFSVACWIRLGPKWVVLGTGRERRGWVQFAFLLNGSGKQISGLGWIGSLNFFVARWDGLGPKWVVLGPRAEGSSLALNPGWAQV